MRYTVRQVAVALSDFVAERFPLWVTAPLGVALAAGPYALAGGGAVTFARSAVSVFLVLLGLRIVDDVHSIPDDRVVHPERALPAGTIAVPPLLAGAGCSVGVAFFIAAGPASVALAGLVLAYAVYFATARRIPRVARPLAVNGVFLWVPVHGALMGSAVDRAAVASLAVFFWLAATGHDYLHDVDGSTGKTRTLERALGSACCAGGFGAGLWLAMRGGIVHAPPLFSSGLIVLFAYLGYLVVRSRARTIYVVGVAAFALPSALLGLDRLLGLWVG